MTEKYGVGQRFGRWLILERLDRKKRLCRCDCGAEKAVRIADLCSGDSRSCGCLNRETTISRNTKHGHAKRSQRHATYKAWCGMRKRCLDPSEPCFANYGGRGITINPSWDSYEQFFADMGNKPLKHSLERLENDGPYTKDNCVWATKKQQARNTRCTLSITFNDKTQSLAAWAEELGEPYAALQARLKKLGWTIERTLSEPVRSTRSRHVL
jgi:hypothetical protein